MKLKRLVIQGFKSFKDRTTIHFDNGITGIVGPNGCGKSNIVDALFWVMGEQSAKHLRGNSMRDVIFSGSNKYGPGSFAEATLVLENTRGKHIHINNKVVSPPEFQLTRKLYRNGETEYRINGAPARLKDIQEVFMDTGAGAKSYSIIAQGEINRLVQAKPVERRTMIEEVAGVTKFKIRRKESLKKIQNTESNLERLSDIKIEIEKNLKNLQKQAEKAERARTLKEKIKKHELIVESHKVFNFLKEIKENSSQLEKNRVSIEEWETKKSLLEVSLESERNEKDELTEEIEKTQLEFNTSSKNLATFEEKLHANKNSITEKIKYKEERINEVKNLEEDLFDRRDKLSLTQEKITDLEDSEVDSSEIDEIEENTRELKNKVKERNKELSEKRNELNQAYRTIDDLEKSIFKNSSKLEDTSSRIEEVTTEMNDLESKFSHLSSGLSDQREKVRGIEESLNAASTRESDLKEDLESTHNDFKETGKKLEHLSRGLLETTSELNSLTKINESLEGASNDTKKFLKENHNYKLLNTIIQTSDEALPVVQAALSLFEDVLVSESLSIDEGSENSNLQVKKLLKVAQESFEVKERLGLKGYEGVRSLSELISVNEVTYSYVKDLFNGVFVVDDIHAAELPVDINFLAIIDKSGKKLISNFSGNIISVEVGDSDLKSTFVARNNKILKLSDEVELRQKEVNQVESELQALESKKSELQRNYDLAREEAIGFKEKFVREEVILSEQLKNLDSGDKKIEHLRQKKEELSTYKFELIKLVDQSESELKEIAERKSVLKSKVESSDDDLEEINEELKSLTTLHTQKKLELDSYQDKLDNFLDQKEDTELQIEKIQEKIDKNNDLIEELNTEVETLKAQSSEIHENVLELKDKLSIIEKDLTKKRDVLSSLLIQMQEREDTVKTLSKQINSTDKELSKIELKIEQLKVNEANTVRDVFEKFRVNLRVHIGENLDFTTKDFEGLESIEHIFIQEKDDGETEIIKSEPYVFVRKYGQDLKDSEFKFKNYKKEYSKLGEINWQAIKDYDEQKLRFDFIQTQEIELKSSLDNLKSAIERIDFKCKERFSLAFNEVNERFQKVFPIIFGGGESQLNIVGSLDDPDCGVDIIARPPGKKMQNINLMSGGEKAMTAVSLIFSIFLVKPSPFCLLDEVDAPLDDANVGRFNELLREMSEESQFILITHNKKTMELNDTLYGVTMQEPGISSAVSVQLN